MNNDWKSIKEILKNISEYKVIESDFKKKERVEFEKKSIKKNKVKQEDLDDFLEKGFVIENIFLDSRDVKGNKDLFLATKGVNVDRKDFINNVINNGCLNIFCSEIPDSIKKDINTKKYENVTFVVISDFEKKVGLIAENFYGNPSEKIKIIGITGTNGKTTIAFTLFNILKKMNQKVALFSTIKNIIGEEIQDSENTTPDPVFISKNLKKAVDQKCNYLIMEVSSHALDQYRVSGIDFDAAVFTNLTQDHMDYHKNMDEYFNTKKRLFDNLKDDAIAISNYDDERGAEILKDTRAKIFSYSYFDNNFYRKHDPDELTINNYFFKDYIIKDGKTDVYFSNKKNDRKVTIGLTGEFNIYNMLAVFAVLSEMGFDKNLILNKIEGVEAPKGRMEVVAKNNNRNILAIVDYAHTPDALKNILDSLKRLRVDSRRIILVAGAGGDRDKTKRPLMGSICVENSDFTFFTSDNPRTEKPEDILNDIVSNINSKNFEVVNSRSKAIKKAIDYCNDGDILVVAGKGHEEYQIIGNEKRYFSDKDEIEKILK